MKLITVTEMRALEQAADQQGCTYAQMMAQAGRGVAEWIQADAGSTPRPHVLGLVGTGNNGGDALVALAHLARAGWHTYAYLIQPCESDPLVADLLSVGGQVAILPADPDFAQLNAWLASSPIILDGLLGTGIRLPLRPDYARLLAHLRATSPAPDVIAVDCPSGVDSETGAAAPETLPARATICMEAVKAGLIYPPAAAIAGQLITVPLGLPAHLACPRELVDAARVRATLPPRAPEAHKGTFGTALIAAGSVCYTGAAYFAAAAAYRSGAGLVTLASPLPLHTALAGVLPEVTWLPLPDADGWIAARAAPLLQNHLARVTALLLGPGWGQSAETAKFMDDLLATPNLPPLVLDADGLRLLARHANWPHRLPPLTILTPHPGEMAALTGLTTTQVQSDRWGLAARCAADWGHIVVLKGAYTVIAAPDGRSAVIPVATPALARAGTGDVLAGLIAGLLAQGTPPYDAALAAAWVHAQAGLLAAARQGQSASVLASDVLAAIPAVLSDLLQPEMGSTR